MEITGNFLKARVSSNSKPLSRFNKKRAGDNFYSVKEFRAILEHECSRADRTGDRFSIVVFETFDINKGTATENLLAKTLSRRLRSVDAVGWLNARSIGIVLPKTPAENARNLVRDMVP